MTDRTRLFQLSGALSERLNQDAQTRHPGNEGVLDANQDNGILFGHRREISIVISAAQSLPVKGTVTGCLANGAELQKLMVSLTDAMVKTTSEKIGWNHGNPFVAIVVDPLNSLRREEGCRGDWKTPTRLSTVLRRSSGVLTDH